MSIRAGTHRLGPEDATLRVRTTRGGAAAKAGHDLLIVVDSWEAVLEVGEDSVPAAAWLDHRLATALEEGDELPVDPQSWALFKAGAARQEEGDDAKAKSLYESALSILRGADETYERLWKSKVLSASARTGEAA